MRKKSRHERLVRLENIAKLLDAAYTGSMPDARHFAIGKSKIKL